MPYPVHTTPSPAGGASTLLPPEDDVEAVDADPAVEAFIAKIRPTMQPAAQSAMWSIYKGSPADTPAITATHTETAKFVDQHPEYLTMPQPATWTGDDIATASPNDPRRGGRHGTADSVYWSQTELDYQAMQLRARGMDYRSIARSMGLVNDKGQPKVSTVHKMVRRALQKAARAHGADEARTIDLERIDKMIERALAIIEGSPSDDRALRAMDRLTALIDQRAKLLGTHAPTKVQTNATLGVNGQLDVRHSGGVEVVSTVAEFLATLDAVVLDEIEAKAGDEYRAALTTGGDVGDDGEGTDGTDLVEDDAA